MWVDDIFYAGVREIEEKVMQKIGEEFMIGRTEEETFQYVGLKISTTDKGITLDQIKYIEDRTSVAVLRGRDKEVAQTQVVGGVHPESATTAPGKGLV